MPPSRVIWSAVFLMDGNLTGTLISWARVFSLMKAAPSRRPVAVQHHLVEMKAFTSGVSSCCQAGRRSPQGGGLRGHATRMRGCNGTACCDPDRSFKYYWV